MNLANQSGASFRSDLNNALAAVLSNNSNASSPSTTVSYMIWADTNANKLKIRNSSNDGWVDLINLDGTIARDITLTGASANIVFDQSENALEFADNAKAVFGTGLDLTISHDGSNSIINDSGVGELQLQRGGNTILSLTGTGVEITDPDGNTELKLTAFENSNANLYLIADEGDDNGDTWLIQSLASNNQLRIINDTSGSNVVKWHITTDGNVTQTGTLIVGGTIKSSTDNAHDLGTGSLRFDDVFATNGTINTSDQNSKNTIATSDLGLDFINKLNPVSYKFNGKTRTHYGLIAQEIETVLGTISKSASQFAGFCKDEVDDDGNAMTAKYGLRYHEFISPMIKAIQELSVKVTALEGS